jgi:hypothetical protein
MTKPDVAKEAVASIPATDLRVLPPRAASPGSSTPSVRLKANAQVDGLDEGLGPRVLERILDRVLDAYWYAALASRRRRGQAQPWEHGPARFGPTGASSPASTRLTRDTQNTKEAS